MAQQECGARLAGWHFMCVQQPMQITACRRGCTAFRCAIKECKRPKKPLLTRRAASPTCAVAADLLQRLRILVKNAELHGLAAAVKRKVHAGGRLAGPQGRCGACEAAHMPNPFTAREASQGDTHGNQRHGTWFGADGTRGAVGSPFATEVKGLVVVTVVGWTADGVARCTVRQRVGARAGWGCTVPAPPAARPA